jgi:single-strand DNA-binding protein
MATITVEGNLTADLSLTVGKGGHAYAGGRVMEDHDKKNDDGTYTELRSLGYDIAIFGHQAENAANSLSKGTRVRVTGTLVPNDFVKDGNNVERTRIIVQSITPSLRYATAMVLKSAKTTDAPMSDEEYDAWADAPVDAPEDSTAK